MHFDRCYIDLQPAVAQLDFQRLPGFDAEFVPEGFRHHDSTGAVDGSFHGMTLPLTAHLSHSKRNSTDRAYQVLVAVTITLC